MKARVGWIVTAAFVATVAVPGCCLVSPPATPATIVPTGETTATVGARVSIDTSAGFVPRTVTITVGEAVVWSNSDTTRHNIGGSGVVSGVLAPGARFAHTFDQAGTYQYLCTFHPDSEEGQVVVEPR